MEIRVERILDNNKILFFSEFGKSIGYWCDEFVSIKKYFVEFDIPDVLDVDNIKKSEIELCSISGNYDGIKIVGLLECYQNDGFATLRMKNNLIFFETVYNNIIKSMVNSYIKIEVNRINLYDIKL